MMYDDLAHDAINIDRRLRIRDRDCARADIQDYAQQLMDWQDGKIALSSIDLEPHYIARGRYIARTIGAPLEPGKEAAPIGVKLPLLYFSPLYHFYQGKLTKVESQYGQDRRLPHLPKTKREIAAYLHSTMADAFYGERLFRLVAGVDIDSIAAFLENVRGTHPAMFLLLLSEEIDLAIEKLPSLDYAKGTKSLTAQWRSDYFPDLACSIASVFRILRTLRRGCAILKVLAARDPFRLSAMKRIAADLNTARSPGEDRKMLRRANHTVYALRKIAFDDLDYHTDGQGRRPGTFRFEKQSSDLRTLAAFSKLAGPDTEYFGTVVEDIIDQARLGLPMGGRPRILWPSSSATAVHRIDLRGGLRRDELACFYGLDGRDIAVHVAKAVAELAGRKIMPDRLANFANVLLEATNYCEPGEANRRVHHVIHADDVIRLAFGKFGEFGHGAGFAATTWRDLEQDKSLWNLLVTSNWSRDPNARMFLEGRRYLYALTHEVHRLGKLERSTRIFCYLAHSMSLLSTDPIWIRIQERIRLLAGVTLTGKQGKHARAGMIGPGPKTIGEMMALLDPPFPCFSRGVRH
ncbi:hypothetical protein [Qipengyuania sp. MTN3-11]|uniref:hypothetical protein n=1 Tax=Qipengyuania sp. MTN3-11 TaxID=3056557 RepID=UPI0036F3C723